MLHYEPTLFNHLIANCYIRFSTDGVINEPAYTRFDEWFQDLLITSMNRQGNCSGLLLTPIASNSKRLSVKDKQLTIMEIRNNALGNNSLFFLLSHWCWVCINSELLEERRCGTRWFSWYYPDKWARLNIRRLPTCKCIARLQLYSSHGKWFRFVYESPP